MAEKDSYIIAAVTKALVTLEQFSADNRELTLTDLSRMTGINKSNMLRILASLESEKFVRFDSEKKKYQLGITMYNLGNTAFGFLDLKTFCYPVLRKVSVEEQLLIHLAIEEDGQVLVIDRIWPNNHVDIAGLVSKIGGTVPLHCTGVGKVLAAYAEPQKLQEMIDLCDFKKYSDRTITNKTDFLKCLEDVRAKGYAVNDGEHEDYLLCITRPIFGRDGKCVGAFSLSGLRTEMEGPEFPHYLDVSKKTADELKGLLR